MMASEYFYWTEGAETFLTTSLLWTSQKLRRIPTRDISSNYLRFVMVRDYVRLGNSAPDGNVLDALDEVDFEHLRTGKSVLVLDLSNEGPAFNHKIIDDLHARLTAHGIPYESVVFAQQNLAFEDDYRAYYNDARMHFVISDFFVKAAGIDFSERHLNITAKEDFLALDYKPAMGVDDGPIYLCLNAALRWHRVLMLRHLMLTDYLKDGLVSFMGAGPDNPKANEIDLYNPPLVVKEGFADYIANIDDWIPRKAIRFDNSGITGNQLAGTHLVEPHARTAFSIVTESDFFNVGVDRITEKLMKAACMGHPMLVAGPVNSINNIKRYGFRAFENVFDHSYDEIADPVDRFRVLCTEITRTISAVKDDRRAWIASIADTAAYNYEHGRRYFLTTYAAVVEQRIYDLFQRILRHS